MIIQLRHWYTIELNYYLKETTGTKSNYEFHVLNRRNEEDQLAIVFEFTFEDEDFFLNGKQEFIFKTDTPFQDEWLESDFVRINAPAIAYPYLRSFISQYTLMAGQEPVILPAVNFVALAEEQK